MVKLTNYIIAIMSTIIGIKALDSESTTAARDFGDFISDQVLPSSTANAFLNLIDSFESALSVAQEDGNFRLSINIAPTLSSTEMKAPSDTIEDTSIFD